MNLKQHIVSSECLFLLSWYIGSFIGTSIQSIEAIESIFFLSFFGLFLVNNVKHLSLDFLFFKHQSIFIPDEVWISSAQQWHLWRVEIWYRHSLSQEASFLVLKFSSQVFVTALLNHAIARWSSSGSHTLRQSAFALLTQSSSSELSPHEVVSLIHPWKA